MEVEIKTNYRMKELSKETDILASCTMYSMMTTSPTTSYSRVTYKALDISYCVSHERIINYKEKKRKYNNLKSTNKTNTHRSER
jgi:hypothetical protein